MCGPSFSKFGMGWGFAGQASKHFRGTSADGLYASSTPLFLVKMNPTGGPKLWLC